MDDPGLERVFNFEVVPQMKQIMNSLRSEHNGRMTSISFWQQKKFIDLMKKNREIINEGIPCPQKDLNVPELVCDGTFADYINCFKNEDMIKGETVSGSCYASARGLAKVAAYMACKGSMNGSQLLS